MAEREQKKKQAPTKSDEVVEDVYGTSELLEPILVESEEHVDWLETQLYLISQVGLQNYLTEQMAGDEGC